MKTMIERKPEQFRKAKIAKGALKWDNEFCKKGELNLCENNLQTFALVLLVLGQL